MAAFSSFCAGIPFIRWSPLNRRPFTISAGLKHDKERSNFFGKFITEHQPPQKSIKYFSNLEFTRKVLENEDYGIVPFFSRYHNDQTGENRFFGRTVNTSTAIPHLLSLRRKNLITPNSLSQHKEQPWHDAQRRMSTLPDAICLMSLGRDLDAHPSIVHGGFQAVLFDEIMRFVILLHQDLVCQPGPRDVHYTANMSISYCAPVMTPTNVLVRSWLTNRDGRKWFTTAEIVDCANSLLTTAESMWVTAKPSRT